MREGERDITDRKRVEAQLAYQANLLANVNDAVIASDENFNITSWNQAAERIYGWKAEEVLGRKGPELLRTQFIGIETSEVFRQLAQSGVWRGELIHHGKDGNPIYMESASIALRDESKRITGYVAVNRDITDRKRTEEALRQSEERYRSLFDRMLDGIYLSTHEGRFVDVNPAFVKMFGYSSKQEMLDIPDIKKELYFSPEERGSHILDTGKEEVEAYRMRRKDGSEIWVEDHGRYVHDEHGNIIYHEGMLRDVTGRKRLEEELRRSSQFLESIIENANIWLNVLDAEKNVLIWNKAAETMSGYSSEEVIGHSKIWEWLYPDEKYRNYISDSVTDVLRGERVEQDVETSIRRKDGQTRVIFWNERSLVDNDGEVIGSIAIGRDVTEQKRMREELEMYSKQLETLVEERSKKLHESEERYRSIVQNIPQKIFIKDRNSVYVSCNDHYAQDLNLKPDEIAGKTDYEFYPRDLADHYRADDKRVIESGKTEEIEEKYVVAGQVFVVDTIKTPIRDAKGNVTGILGIFWDITQRKQMEEELRGSRDQLEHLLATNPAVIYFEEALPDFSDTYSTYVSESARFVLGFEPTKFLGESGLSFWRSRLHPEDLARYSAELPSLWRDGHHTFEYRFLHSDGTYRWISEQYRVIRDAQGHISNVVTVATDVTERKELEEKLAKAERFAIIGETAAMVGHDLRNPLQGITGALHLLRHESLTTKERDDMLHVIEKSVAYSDAIVSDLSDYSSEIKLKLAEATPKSIMRDAIGAVEVPPDLTVQDLSKDQPIFRVDPGRMKRAFINLIENAIDAMPQGGTLKIGSKQIDRTVEITFSDTGTGMPARVVESLWKPLQTTKAKGLGLGLAICKRVIDAHGGNVSVKSKIGEGTTVTIRLPLKPEAAEVKQE